MTSLGVPLIDPRLLADEKSRLSELPYFDRDPTHARDGVLLSDQIEHYCWHGFQDDRSFRPLIPPARWL